MADFRDTGFFCAFAPALLRPADFIVDFFGVDFFEPLFRLSTVLFAISRPIALVGTLEAPEFRVETGGRLLTLNVRDESVSKTFGGQKPEQNRA